MRLTTLQRLVRWASDAIEDLGGTIDPRHLETLATDVHESMSAGGRSFHDVHHAFDVARDAPAVQVLAGLFHDTVYLQVDGGLPSRLQALLGDAYRLTDEGLQLVLDDDPWRHRLAALFGFEDGQVLSPFAGLNEYLSALFAVRRLAKVLPTARCLEVAACIEATIPFRRDQDGLSATEALAGRLDALVRAEGLALDVAATVHHGVALANRDIANFAYADAARFLDNTWQLLPESNAQLRVRVYSIDQYHLAMKKMRGFFAFLDPDVVFTRFRDVPDLPTWTAWRDAAARNIATGHRYLSAKLLAASVLQAIARSTGGDAPISLFMGDLPSVDPTSPQLQERLTAPPRCAEADPEVYRLLVEGRTTDGGFDLKNAPLAGYLYAHVGEATHDLLTTYSTDGAAALLDALPTGALRHILLGCAELAVTRRAQLLDMADRLA